MLFKNRMLLMCYFIVLTSCNSIEDTNWKYRSGFHIGDGITFNLSLIIKSDTIFLNSIPEAIFMKIEQRISDRLLIIKELNGEGLGYYCSK